MGFTFNLNENNKNQINFDNLIVEASDDNITLEDDVKNLLRNELIIKAVLDKESDFLEILNIQEGVSLFEAFTLNPQHKIDDEQLVDNSEYYPTFLHFSINNLSEKYNVHIIKKMLAEKSAEDWLDIYSVPRNQDMLILSLLKYNYKTAFSLLLNNQYINQEEILDTIFIKHYKSLRNYGKSLLHQQTKNIADFLYKHNNVIKIKEEIIINQSYKHLNEKIKDRLESMIFLLKDVHNETIEEKDSKKIKEYMLAFVDALSKPNSNLNQENLANLLASIKIHLVGYSFVDIHTSIKKESGKISILKEAPKNISDDRTILDLFKLSKEDIEKAYSIRAELLNKKLSEKNQKILKSKI